MAGAASTEQERRSAGSTFEFLNVLSDQLVELLSAPSERVDEAVVSTQRALCRFLGMDRSAIWQGSSASPETLALTYLCTLDEIPAFDEGITTNKAFPWFTRQLLDGKVVAVPDVDALPPEAATDRESLTYFLDKSTLAIPFTDVPDAPKGAISFTATSRKESWSESVLAHCRLVAQVIQGALARKRAYGAARDERTRLRDVLDSAHDIIWFVDSETYALVTWNRTYEAEFRRLTGKTVRAGDTLADLFDTNSERIERWTQLYERTLREGPFSIEFQVDVDDATFLLAFNAVVREGAKVGIAVFGRDITVQKRQQRELDAVRNQLFQSQKLEAVGRIAAGVAHDLNNILTVVSTASHLVATSEERTGSGADENLKAITDAVGRANALTGRLLAFTRPQPRAPRVLDLGRAVAGTQELLRRVIRENIQLTLTVQPQKVCVVADPTQLDQVLLNLSVNARDAMPDGGQLVIDVSSIELDAQSAEELDGLVPGRYAKLTVRDTGEGIPKENLVRAFDPFFTTKELGKGTGLGLATALAVVKQSGGRIRLESEPGLGTAVTVFLPEVDASEMTSAAPPAPRTTGGTETVLVVDDDVALRNLLPQLLARQGYTALVAADGNEALAIVMSAPNRIDLLVTDLAMPRVSGTELARALRAKQPMGVLFISGFSDVPEAELSRLSSVPLLRKPFSNEAFTSAVRAALDAEVESRRAR